MKKEVDKRDPEIFRIRKARDEALAYARELKAQFEYKSPFEQELSTFKQSVQVMIIYSPR